MARYRTRRFLHALTGGVALIAMAQAAQAQEAEAPSTGNAAEPGLGEIIVTAQKRAENVQDTPIAITAISSDRISQGGLDNPTKLQFTVPSMTYGEVNGFAQITLRGVGNDTTLGAESSVATYQDGVYTGMQITGAVPTFDLERIEVLRGPQGTLYGRNTTGGVVNYITKSPEFDFGGIAEASYGNYDTITTNLGLTGPIAGDKVAFRASFHFSDHDGYFRNIVTGDRDYAGHDIGGRAAILVRPTENFSLTLRGDVAQSKSTNSFALISSTGLDGLSGPLTPLGIFSQPAAFFQAVPGLLSPADIAKLNGGSIAQYYGLTEATVAPPDVVNTRTIASPVPTRYVTDASGLSLTADWDAGSTNVKSITAYRFGKLFNTGDVGGESYPLLYSIPIAQQARQYTQEFNISGDSFGNKLEWLVGAFGYHEDSRTFATYYVPTFADIVTLSSNLTNPAGSPYTFNLNPATLTPISQFPGTIPNSIWRTAVFSGPSYPGDAAGPTLTQDTSLPSTPFFGQRMEQKSDSLAGFVQATYHITDDLRFTGGFRYTIDRKKAHRVYHSNLIYDLTAIGIYQAVQAGFLPPSAYTEDALAAAAGLCETNTRKTWKKPTGMVGVDFDAGENVLTYGKVSWGYKAGGMNPSECNSVYNPEYLTAYEAGVKAVMADGQVLTNLAVYYYDYTDIQFTTYQNNASSVQNAGSAKSFGVELEYAIRPRFAEGFQFDGSASFQDSKYGASCFGDPANTNNAGFLTTTDQACPATVVNPTTGLAVPIGPSANIKGNELIRAPRWKLNFGAQYSTDVAGFGGLTARVDAAWTDKIYHDIFNGKVAGLEGRTQPAHWLVNAQLGWTSPDKRLAAMLYGDNLTNEIYFNETNGYNLPPTEYNVVGQLAPPRTYGIRLTAKFGGATY